MENQLTRNDGLAYPVSRKNMDDNIEQKEAKLDQPVGTPVSEAEKQKQEQKDREDKEKQARYLTATKLEQGVAKKLWDAKIKEIEDRGQKVPDELLKLKDEQILQGVGPSGQKVQVSIGGASNGGAFAEFDPENYDNEALKRVAEELKSAGEKEEITDDKLQEIGTRLDLLVAGGEISEDEAWKFKRDINTAREKSRLQAEAEQNNPAGAQREAALPQAESASSEDDRLTGHRQDRAMINDLGTPGANNAEILNTLEQQMPAWANAFGKQQRQQKQNELVEILGSKTPDLQEKKRRLGEFLDKLVAVQKKNIIEGRLAVPQEIESIQDLAKFIMERQETALYGIGGRYALLEKEIDKETGEIVYENGEIVYNFRPDNFLIWVRDQIIQLHDDNRTGEMQPLSQVAIETQIRTVTIYMMQRFKGQYFKDQRTGEIMTDLADTAVNMCYLFGFFRNMDLAYKQAMNSDEELPKNIVGIHAKNDVTHGDNWAQFLSMPDKFGQALRGPDGNPLRGDKGEVLYDRDTRVGDAELVANDIYYNISDMDELEDIVGKDGALLTKEGFKRTLLLQQILAGNTKHEWDNEPSEEEGFYENGNFYYLNKDTGEKKAIFKSDGSLDKVVYLEFVNFFNAPTPDKTQIDFVRSLIQLTIAEKAGLETGLARDDAEKAERKAKFEKLTAEKGIDDAQKDYKRVVNAARINTRFAEYSSFVQQRPLMVAARNDTNRRGYDASTKMDLNYFLRQSRDNTAGPIGNTEFLKHQIIKNFAVDFVVGLKTESKRSPYEIFKDIRDVMNGKKLLVEANGAKRRMTLDEIQKAKENLLDELRFQENAASDYSSNAIKRSFDIFHQVIDAQSLDLNKIVSKNFLEGIKYNTAEFEKQIKDDFIKPMRYAFSSNAALKFGQIYRGFEGIDKDTKLPKYVNKTLADHMFGDEVLDDIRKDAEKNKLKVTKFENGVQKPTSDMSDAERYQEYLNSTDGRTRIVKNIARARLAAELRKHRTRWGPGERWSPDMVNKFIMSLETIKAYEKDENGNIFETNKRFFTESDIAWIRQNSGTGYKKMMAEEAGKDLLSGSLKGAYEGAKEIFEYVFK